MFNSSHVHPMLVHFPIALVLLGFVVEIAAWIFKKEEWLPKASTILLILGSLSILAAYLSGEFLTGSLSGEAGQMKEQHELFAKVSMALVFLVTLLKIFLTKVPKNVTVIKYLVPLLYLIAAVLVSYTGYLGGTLVINYLIGL